MVPSLSRSPQPCSSLGVFLQMYTEISKKNVSVYLAAVKVGVRRVLLASDFFSAVPKECLFPTLKDAVAIAYRNGSSSHFNLAKDVQ